jgi:dihydrofolate reductase
MHWRLIIGVVQVFIIAAMSADGFIAQYAEQRSVDWRSKADGRFFIERTKAAGVMVMGSTTFNTFRVRRAPAGRRLIVYTRHPEAVAGENIETTDETPAALVARLEREGAHELAVCGGAAIDKLFMDSGLVDALYLTVEPVLFGAGVPLFSGEVAAGLSLLENRQLSDNTVLLHYAVGKK